MHLKKLEISGFKSFAKTTALEFPSQVTAIVGPNGSGKSNIKEAIQWVLGEQSMKSLRGKRGEDLIWNGSQHSPRAGKASVTLIFDNKNGGASLDFEEIIVSRKIFRDGTNEYYINNSSVRLKDVGELTARMGLGETKHNIIGQGEVDRILLASPEEKREMLEEALGLRVFRLKKNETERKLNSTENNMRQVEALLHEISPHLKFLRGQVTKHKTREFLAQELSTLQKIYLSREKTEISAERERLEEKQTPIFKKKKELEKEIERNSRQIEAAEKKLTMDSPADAEKSRLASLEAKRRELERELGRLEGKYELEKEKVSLPRLRIVDTDYIRKEIKKIVDEVKSAVRQETESNEMKARLFKTADRLDMLLLEIQKGSIEENTPASNGILRETERLIEVSQEDIRKIVLEVEQIKGLMRSEELGLKIAQIEIRKLDGALRALENEKQGLELHLERLKFEEEKISAREAVFHKNLKEANIKQEDLCAPEPDEFTELADEDLKRKIERLRARLEEVGGIDASVIKEYEDLEARSAFLAKELADLEGARDALKKLLKELDSHIRNSFREGVSGIKEEFNKFFRMIFGGGKAILVLLKSEPPVKNHEEDNIVNEAALENLDEPYKEGIEISVDLPRKRIKGLAMLSGGERALTSIALLFAITAIKPPPFLILDETDAALDEANTQRYASILKELSSRTQLILVTHNRETMKSAGVLYGVTMGEDGVSKLLSLKFAEAAAYTDK